MGKSEESTSKPHSASTSSAHRFSGTIEKSGARNAVTRTPQASSTVFTAYSSSVRSAARSMAYSGR